jgi:hypothetical protein
MFVDVQSDSRAKIGALNTLDSPASIPRDRNPQRVRRPRPFGDGYVLGLFRRKTIGKITQVGSKAAYHDITPMVGPVWRPAAPLLSVD